MHTSSIIFLLSKPLTPLVANFLKQRLCQTKLSIRTRSKLKEEAALGCLSFALYVSDSTWRDKKNLTQYINEHSEKGMTRLILSQECDLEALKDNEMHVKGCPNMDQ